MYCPKCGNEITDGAKFCTSCGAKLTKEAESQVQVPKQSPQPAPSPAPAPVSSPAPAPLPKRESTKQTKKPAGKSKAGRVFVTILLILFLCTMAAGAGIFVYRHFSETGNSAKTSAPQENAWGKSAKTSKEETPAETTPSETETTPLETETTPSETETTLSETETTPSETEATPSETETTSSETETTSSETEMTSSETEVASLSETISAPDGEFVIPNSDRVYLTNNDLSALTKEQLRVARNEIYARHGRLFKDEALQAYFNSCSWYKGTIAPERFNESVLNDMEKKNLVILKEREAQLQ